MNCPICGKSFTPKDDNKLFCSDQCRQVRASMGQLFRQNKSTPPKKQDAQIIKLLPPNECHACNKTFKPAYTGEKFCSDECRFQFFKTEFIIALGKFLGIIKDPPDQSVYLKAVSS